MLPMNIQNVMSGDNFMKSIVRQNIQAIRIHMNSVQKRDD